jgi:hypothetical protein
MAELTTAYSVNWSESGATVPLDIIPLAGQGNAQQAIHTSLQIGSESKHDLRPGAYLVRCTLPSGEMLSEQVEVGDNPIRIEFQSQLGSPREDLAWAYQLIPNSSLSNPLSEFRLASELAAIPSILPDFKEGSTPVRSRIMVAEQLGNVQPASPQSPLKIALLGEDWKERLGLSPFELTSATSSLRLFGIEAELAVYQPIEPRQYWLRLSGIGPQKVFAIPYYAWHSSHDNHRPPVAVLIESSPDEHDQDGLTVKVRSPNPQVNALVGYLARGDYDASRRASNPLVENVRKLLQGETDPMAAVVVGYFLLRAGDPAQLGPWTETLAENYGWLPDGAVIRAWHLWRSSTPDLNQVAEWLTTAAERGVPAFTQGLRLLHDGLRLLMQEESLSQNDQIRNAFNKISHSAQTADWRHVTTALFE